MAPSDVQWTWVGPHREDDGWRFYKAVRMEDKSRNLERVYYVGDVVLVDGGGLQGRSKEQWVGQVIELLEKVVDPLDSDIEVVSDDYAKQRMRCTIRWFYSRQEVAKRVRLNRCFDKAIASEYCFSDHVDKKAWNSVEVIDAKVFLSDSLRKYKLHNATKPTDFKNGDKIVLVRLYFDNFEVKVRELERKELFLLLDKVTSEPLFSPRWTRMLVSKGTIKRHHNGAPSANGTSPEQLSTDVVPAPLHQNSSTAKRSKIHRSS